MGLLAEQLQLGSCWEVWCRARWCEGLDGSTVLAPSRTLPLKPVSLGK